MDKIKSITKKWRAIMSFKALVIFLLILTPAISHASTMMFIEVAPHLVSGTTYCIPQSAKSNPLGYHFTDYGPPYNTDHLQFQGFNSGTYTGTAPGSLTISNPNNNGSGGDANTGFTCEGSYNVDVSTLGAGNVAMLLFQVGYQAGRTNDWVNNDVGYVYYALFNNYVPTYIPPVSDTSTRIIDFAPAQGAVLAGPNISFSMHAYVNPADIGTWLGVQFTLHNIDQNVLLLSAFSPNDIVLLDNFQATTSGDFYFATTTAVGNGNYRVNAKLKTTFAGFQTIFNAFSSTNQDLSHQFCINDTGTGQCGTFIGTMSQNGYEILHGKLASTSPSITIGDACMPITFGGTFGFEQNASSSIEACATALFVPDGNYLDTTMQGLKDGVLSRIPWGYLTRTYNIWNSPATTSLPSFTATISMGPGDSSSPELSTITFDPGDMLAGAGVLLADTRDPIYGKNAQDVMGPMAQLSIAIAVLFTIIADLTGSHRHHTDTGGSKQKKLS
jgi:hypothetical protein